MTPIQLVVLDRDGTINFDRDDFVKSADEWVPLPGAIEAIARLNHAGWHTVIATNQSGIGRRLFDMEAFTAMHVKMNRALAQVGGRVDSIFFCPHAPEESCRCRKPLPGLMELIGERYGIALAEVPMVGDALRDLQAAAACGAPPHLVRTGKCAGLGDAEIAEIQRQVPSTQVHADLAAFAEHLIRSHRPSRGASGRLDNGHGRLD